MNDATLVGPYRHTAGPPISEADLATMAGVRENPRRYRSDEADPIVTLVATACDRARFPWLDVEPPRRPDTTERRAAVLSTAALWATQRMATKRRNESADRQEEAVLALLRATPGFTEVPARREVNAIDDLACGDFCAESTVAGVKADVVVRLLDGRLLLIECKVSGSSLNSIKRLIHDVGDKVAVWRQRFGEQQIPMAVIAGVFKLKHLLDAQAKGISIVWERDLNPLGDFLSSAIP